MLTLLFEAEWLTRRRYSPETGTSEGTVVSTSGAKQMAVLSGLVLSAFLPLPHRLFHLFSSPFISGLGQCCCRCIPKTDSCLRYTEKQDVSCTFILSDNAYVLFGERHITKKGKKKAIKTYKDAKQTSHQRGGGDDDGIQNLNKVIKQHLNREPK